MGLCRLWIWWDLYVASGLIRHSQFICAGQAVVDQRTSMVLPPVIDSLQSIGIFRLVWHLCFNDRCKKLTILRTSCTLIVTPKVQKNSVEQNTDWVTYVHIKNHLWVKNWVKFDYSVNLLSCLICTLSVKYSVKAEKKTEIWAILAAETDGPPRSGTGEQLDKI